jgi:predicted nucleic acid-binding protein
MIVVDNSIAVKWVFMEDLSADADALLDREHARGSRVVAPPLLMSEFANTVRQRMRRVGLSLDEALDTFDQLAAAGVELLPATPDGQLALSRSAVQFAARFGLPAAYDAHYIALAEALGCELWTADTRLVRAVGGRLPLVRSLATFSADQPGASRTTR